MKKVLLLFSALALYAGANAAVGDTFAIDGVTYVVESDNTVGIKKVDSKLTAVTLSDKVTNDGVEYTVVSVGDQAFYYSKATDVTLPSTVKTIGYYAFGSSSLTNITLPEGLETIGDYAFYACRNMTKIDIPDNVSVIGPDKGCVFSTCYALKEIKFPAKIKYIAPSSFYNCKALESVVIPEGVTEIRRVAFNTCEALKTITLPSTLETIGDGAFGGCKSLAIFNGNFSNIKSIGEEGFFDCAFTEFAIPNSLENVGSRAFACTPIEKFSIGSNANYKIIDEALYTADKRLLVAFPPKSATTNFTVADGCVGIAGGAFQTAGVTSVTLPASVVAVDEFAFCQSALSTINYTDNLVYIGEQAFAATKLTSVVLPQGLRNLADATFAGCTSLTSVTFGTNLENFGIRQFYECTALKELHFKSANVPSIGYWEYTREAPFYGVPAKQVTLYCPKGLSTLYKNEFSCDAIGTYSDTETAVLVPTEFSPANNAEVTTLDKLTVTFAEDITVVSRNPKIKVLCGNYVGNIPMGSEVSVGMWSVIGSDKKAPQIVPLDEYGEDGNPINMEKGKEYFVIIPAGTFKNADGALNQEITLHYVGTWVEPQFMPVSIDPADGSELEKIENIYLTFESKVSKAYGAENKIKLIQGSLVDGVPVGTEVMGSADEWHINLSDTKVQIFPCDYDLFLCPITLEADKDYYFVVDQGAFRDASYVYNKQIIVHYAKGAGVSVVENANVYAVKSGDVLNVYLSDASANVALYTATGALVNAVDNAKDEVAFEGLSHGLYIVKVVAGKDVKTFKVMM